MTKVAIVTDLTAYLPEDLVSAYNISVVPLVVIWSNETLRDNVDVGHEEFYDRLSNAKVIPSTSQATIKNFADVFEKLHHEGYEILTLVISAGLSGTFDSAIQATKMVPDVKVERVDSKLTSIPLSFMALYAAQAAKRGTSLAECKKIAEQVRDNSEVFLRRFFAVDTLKFLHRGGRIGGASRFLGTALNLKPILFLQEGKIEALEKVRTSRRAHHRLIELLRSRLDGKSPVNLIGVVGAAADETMAHLFSEIKSQFNPDEIMMADPSPVIGAHTGPGTVGVACVAGVDREVLKA